MIITYPIFPTLEPKNLSEAMENENWHAAILEEFDTLMRNGTRDLVPLGNHNLVGCHWVFSN